MLKITEEFLHFIWKNQSLTGILLESENDSSIEVLDPGVHNLDSGPDFFNSKISIDGTTWAGNVEIHINASDWMKHGHHHDPAYDSIILHVVYFNDCSITRSNNHPVPTTLLRFPHILWEEYMSLMKTENWIACENRLYKINLVHQAQWTSRMMVEKLTQKHYSLNALYLDSASHWEDMLNRIVFRCFGMPVNTMPFELIASQIPYTYLLRIKSDLQQLESLLFGASGMLNKALPADKYMEALIQEYAVHQLKLRLPGIQEHLWKFMRMRPSSFPSVRIAQLSVFIHTNYQLFELLKTTPSIKKLEESLRVRASDYWNTHYIFGKESKFQIKYTGKDFFFRLVINGIVPFMFFYGKTIMEDKYCEYAISLLEKLPPEKNVILKNWNRFGMKAENAFDSQGLLHLHNEYCRQNRCLECQFGNFLILHGKNP
jgi:hypothetical protein